MSLYYVVKLYTEHKRASPDYLGSRRAEHSGVTSLGVVAMMEAKRFLWKDEAFTALKQFMGEHGGERIVRGQVFYVTEEAVDGHEVGQSSEPSPETVAEEPAAPLAFDPSEGEALLVASENLEEGDDSREPYQEAAHWLYEHADDLFAWVRKGQRLDWLRMHPESCRATRDCQEPRKKGLIFCEACLSAGGGGYFDVYRSYYVTKFNNELERMMAERFKIQVTTGISTSPEES